MALTEKTLIDPKDIILPTGHKIIKTNSFWQVIKFTPVEEQISTLEKEKAEIEARMMPEPDTQEKTEFAESQHPYYMDIERITEINLRITELQAQL